MMRELSRHIERLVVTLLSVLALGGCDIHEWPEELPPEIVPFTIHLDFDTSMPIYEDISYANTKAEMLYDKRYILGVYPYDRSGALIRQADTLIVFTKDSEEDYNHTLHLNIPEGNYSFICWTDYVADNRQTDLYYKTDDFEEIILSDRKNHIGNTDYRDAFRGEKSVMILPDNPYYAALSRADAKEITIDMRRPMAKFKIIATDLKEFERYARKLIAQKAAEKGNTRGDTETRAFNLEDYRVVFRYNGFMPCSFNMFTDKPADSWTGVSFESRMSVLSPDEAEVGFDYVFVNGNESSVSVTIEIYDWDNDLVSRSSPIQVPIVRSQLTVVRGAFLTTKAAGGVGIVPEFDGDYNYVVP